MRRVIYILNPQLARTKSAPFYNRPKEDEMKKLIAITLLTATHLPAAHAFSYTDAFARVCSSCRIVMGNPEVRSEVAALTINGGKPSDLLKASLEIVRSEAAQNMGADEAKKLTEIQLLEILTAK